MAKKRHNAETLVAKHLSTARRPRISSSVRYDSLQMQVHRMNIGTRSHESGANAAVWTDGAEQVGRLVALIARGCGSAAAPRPDAGQAALLADAGLILT